MKEIIQLFHADMYEDGVAVLQDFNLQINSGHITVIAGLHGSRKHDVMRAVNGESPITGGSLFLHGKRYQKYDITDAIRGGILTLHHEKTFLPSLNTEDSLFGFSTMCPPFSVFRRRLAKQQTNKLCENLHIPHYGGVLSYRMTLFEEHMLRIEKARAGNLSLIILDLCNLDYNYIQLRQMWKLCESLREENIATLIITDYIDPEINHADIVYYMRNGAVVKIGYPGELTRREQFLCLSGIDLSLQDDKHCRPERSEAESVSVFVGEEKQFNLFAGQALAILDLQRNDVFSDFSYLKEFLDCNKVELRGDDGEILSLKTIAEAKKIVLDPSDSAALLFENLSVAGNLACPALPRFCGFMGRINQRMVHSYAERFRALTGIDPGVNVRELHLGERKLLAIYRWIVFRPDFLVLDNPFFSLDITYYDLFRAVVDEVEAAGIHVICADKRTDGIFRVFDRIIINDDAKYLDIVPCNSRESFTRALQNIIRQAEFRQNS